MDRSVKDDRSVTLFEQKYAAQKKPSHSPLHGNNLKARNVGEVHVDFRGRGEPTHQCVSDKHMNEFV